MDDEVLDTTTKTIGSSKLLSTLIGGELKVKEVKERIDAEKVDIRNKIIAILDAEDISILNRNRCREFLKDNKLRSTETNIKLWKKTKNPAYKRMDKISASLLCIWTAKYSEHQLYKVLSECQDRENRKQSPNLYAWSLRKRRV